MDNAGWIILAFAVSLAAWVAVDEWRWRRRQLREIRRRLGLQQKRIERWGKRDE